MNATLDGDRILDADLPDWRFLLQRLHARFTYDDYAVGLALVAAIGEHVQEVDHHPDLDLRYGALAVATSSHDVGGVTERDVALARRVSELAAELGARPAPSSVQVLEIALDTPDLAAVRPFWQAVLGLSYDDARPHELTDGTGTVPALWFQECAPEPAGAPEGRMRFHLDITVPHDVAEARVAAALEAGGTLVSDSAARAFWVLADAQGNKACVCTWQDRD